MTSKKIYVLEWEGASSLGFGKSLFRSGFRFPVSLCSLLFHGLHGPVPLRATPVRAVLSKRANLRDALCRRRRLSHMEGTTRVSCSTEITVAVILLIWAAVSETMKISKPTILTNPSKFHATKVAHTQSKLSEMAGNGVQSPTPQTKLDQFSSFVPISTKIDGFLPKTKKKGH